MQKILMSSFIKHSECHPLELFLNIKPCSDYRHLTGNTPGVEDVNESINNNIVKSFFEMISEEKRSLIYSSLSME